MTERVRLQREGDGLLLLCLQDEAEKNTFHHAFIAELQACLRAIGEDKQARVCVVRGLPEVFCAGAGEALLAELAGGDMLPGDIVLSRQMLEVPIPVIAAMEGHAVGGGLALALCCDLLLLARESRYGCSFLNMGFTPGMGTTRLLREVVGEPLAAEMMYGGQLFKGAHFEGRVNYVLPRAQVWPKALELAHRIAEKPRFALELLKRDLSTRRRQLLDDALKNEAQMHQLCFARPETAERIKEGYPRAPGK
jgi:polyketide biosynthesis enoyl-CoA hydratase PksI